MNCCQTSGIFQAAGSFAMAINLTNKAGLPAMPFEVLAAQRDAAMIATPHVIRLRL